MIGNPYRKLSSVTTQQNKRLTILGVFFLVLIGYPVLYRIAVFLGWLFIEPYIESYQFVISII